jgi:S1-C subfamily serine protease
MARPSGTQSFPALQALSEDLTAAVERAGRAVVAVHARRRIPASGVLWRSGIVVATNHTIQQDEEITVSVGDGVRMPATLAGRDPSTDLAVLRLDPAAGGSSPATVAERGADDTLRVGQIVLALGRPGRDVTASLGLVSAVGGEWRTWHGGKIDRLVRLDVAVYDGFSGGPLVDGSSHVLGINTSGLSRGAALTIPATTVDHVVSQLLETGRIKRGYAGVAVQPVRIAPAAAESLGLTGSGALMAVGVAPGGPADKSGILQGDVLVAVDGARVSDPSDLLSALGPDRVGQRVRVQIIRAGESRTVELTVGERPVREER